MNMRKLIAATMAFAMASVLPLAAIAKNVGLRTLNDSGRVTEVGLSLDADIAFDVPTVAHWTNASGDNCWTNPANWAEGKVPGRFVCDYVSSTDLRRDDLQMFGTAGCTAVFGAGATAGLVSYVKLGGLYSISNVVIEAGAADPFIFGEWDTPPLPLERGGGIWIREGVTNETTVKAELAPGAGSSGGESHFYLRNDGMSVLKTCSIGAVTNFLSSTGWTVLTQMLRGSGEIRRLQHFYTSGFKVNLSMEMSGGTYVPNCANASQQNGYGGITAQDNGFRQNIRIDADKVLYVTDNGQWERPLLAKGDLLIDGAGELRINAKNWAMNFEVAQKKTLTIACNLAPFGGAHGYSLHSQSAGVLKMTGNFLGSANPSVAAGTLQVARIGMERAASPLGTGDGVTLSGGTLRYVGAGERTDRVLTLTAASALEQGGTDDLVFLNAPSGSFPLTLRNDSSTSAVAFAASVGTPLVLSDNARLAAVAPSDTAAELSFASLTLEAGAHVLRIDDGVTLTVSSLVGGGETATLDVIGSGTVKFPGFAAGLLPAWLTRNGSRTGVDATGEVKALSADADREIDARGGVIPNAPDEIVAIATANGTASGVTLAADETAVLVLRQEQSVEPAVVSVAAGQTFSPQMVEVADGAKPLVFAGEGRVAPFALKGDGVGRENEAMDARVRLSGDGKATVALGGALSEASPLNLKVTDGVARLAGEGIVPATVSVTDGGNLSVAGGAFRQAGLSLGDSADPQPALAVGTNGVGTLTVESGSWTGRLAVATGGGTGTVLQRGGEVVNVSRTSGEVKWFGVDAHGYYELSGGRFLSAGASLLGESGIGIFDVCGGTLSCTPSSVRRMGTWTIGGWESLAAVTVRAGGKVDFSDSGVIAGQTAVLAPYYSRWRTETVFTVERGGEVDLGEGVYCAGSGTSNDFRPSIVNLNGGTFRAHSIMRSCDTVYPNSEFPHGTATDAQYTNCPVYVNFDGGTFRPTSWAGIFGASASTAYFHPPTRITVFAGGATIDTTDVDCEISVGSGLRAPTGQGIASVPLDDATRSRAFDAPPYVRIAGDGSGATAVADFDAVRRCVTGIRVTSPGWNYTVAEAHLILGKETVATLPALLAANTSGGLTKTGSGMLRVAATNTYTGATRLCAGTVRLLCDNAFNAASALVLDGGTLDLAGHRQTFSDVTCNSGSVVDGKLSGQVGVTGLTVDFQAATTGAVKRVDERFCRFADGAVLAVTGFNPARLDPARRYTLVAFAETVPQELVMPVLDLPRGWVMKIFGRRIRLVREYGAAVIVR